MKDPKYDGYQCGLASMFYKSFNKKSFIRLITKNSDDYNQKYIKIKCDLDD